MAIGRMQMNRQLYGLGSYFPPENGREKFGLGSKLKKFVRKIIPNEVSEIAVKAAPFVAPFNPLLAGYMAGIGGFDQTGRIGSSLKSGLLTYGGGQLARGIGGAGFQKGFNPFSNVSFSGGIMSGLGQTFTSPVSGAPLFGQSVTPVQPTITPTQQDIASGTSRASEIAKQAGKTLSERTDIDQFGSIQDYLAQTDPSKLTATKATRGYMDITKDLFSGDITARGNAAKELGGKALKDIYTNPVINPVTGKTENVLDKTAVIATLSAIPSYLDAKKAADDSGLEEFDEATYNAERDKYMERYKANLPASSFGIQAAANGGRIGYGDGTKPSAEENTPSQEIINRRIAQIKDMSKRGADIDTIKSITGASDQMIKDVLGQVNGGRIGYAEGSNLEQSMDEYLKALDAYTKEFGLKEGYSRAQNDYKYLFEKKANGGRIGYAEGSREGIVSLTDQNSGVVYRDPKTGEPLTIDEFLRRAAEDEAEIQLLKEGEEPGSQFISRPDDAPSIRLPEKGIPSLEMKAGGGRMGYMMGMEVPMRQNQGGISELDYRKTGGFVPVGVKEKADDVPAMLSKNEFVFTADAVRGAGKGDINKGAKMMYAKMKALEGKVKKFKKTKKKKVKV
jgi:hypothetical protein